MNIERANKKIKSRCFGVKWKETKYKKFDKMLNLISFKVKF